MNHKVLHFRNWKDESPANLPVEYDSPNDDLRETNEIQNLRIQNRSPPVYIRVYTFPVHN